MAEGQEKRAPHKPLLLLTVIELAEEGALTDGWLHLSPELIYRFQSYWKVVVNRWTRRPDLRLPFHHLKSDGVWSPFTAEGKPSAHRSLTASVELRPSFLAALANDDFRRRARATLIHTYFMQVEQVALCELVGLQQEVSTAEAEVVMAAAVDQAKALARDARFRIKVVSAYDFTCALTGYRLTTLTGATIVDAAHIHQHAKSRNDDPTNGLALCKNAHWMFDEGLWTLTDELRVRVSAHSFVEAGPEAQRLRHYEGRSLIFPPNTTLRPDLQFVRWHRENCFEG